MTSFEKNYKYNVGDFVRLSLRKHLFKMGYKANFIEEVFKITKITEDTRGI